METNGSQPGDNRKEARPPAEERDHELVAALQALPTEYLAALVRGALGAPADPFVAVRAITLTP